MLGSYRHCCRFCARADRAVKTVREKASLFRSCLPPKREVKHLSSRPSRDQPIADLKGENLLCLSAGRLGDRPGLSGPTGEQGNPTFNPLQRKKESGCLCRL